MTLTFKMKCQVQNGLEIIADCNCKPKLKARRLAKQMLMTNRDFKHTKFRQKLIYVKCFKIIQCIYIITRKRFSEKTNSCVYFILDFNI